jgi:hypothetical protein
MTMHTKYESAPSSIAANFLRHTMTNENRKNHKKHKLATTLTTHNFY